MENNNQTTTHKLEDAIIKLLDAYEILQNESNQKDQTIKTLENKIHSLEESIANIEDNNGRQDTILGGLLGKVESIISGSSSVKDNTVDIVTDQQTLTFDDNQDDTISAINIDDIVVNPDKITNKTFDEDRMNKLLGGFN